MKNILVPLDFTDVSRNALTYAIAFAESLDARVTLFHAYHTIPAIPEFPSESHDQELEELRSKAQKSLESVCAEVDKGKVECAYVNLEGYARESIIQYADQNNPDLIIMGTESISPIDKIIFGTTTGKVLKKVSCPILVIPQETKYQPLKKIAFAIDYHENDLEDIQFMIPLARKFNAELHVVRVATGEVNMEFEDKLMTDFRYKVDQAIHDNSITWHLVKEGNVVDQLEKYVNETDINLVSAAKTRMNPLLKVFFGSVTQKLFYHTHIPLLIFQAKDTDLRASKMTKRSSYE